MSQAKLSNNRIQIQNPAMINQTEEKCMKESSKVNHPNSLQSHNHQIFDMVYDERETNSSNYNEVRDLKFPKYEHHPPKMTTESFPKEFIGRKQHRDLKFKNPQHHQHRSMTEMDMIPDFYPDSVPFPFYNKNAHSRNPSFREFNQKKFPFDSKRQNNFNPHYRDKFQKELKYWVCSNPECGFKKNFLSKPYCHYCHSDKSPNAEIITISISDNNSNSHFPNNIHFKRALTNDSYRQHQFIVHKPRHDNPKIHNEGYLPDSSENYDRMMNKDAKEQPKLELNDKLNSLNQMPNPCKIVPDSSVIFSTYTYQEIEKAVTFLKLVDKIKNKQKLMNMIKELAAEEGGIVEGDCSKEDPDKNKQKA